MAQRKDQKTIVYLIKINIEAHHLLKWWILSEPRHGKCLEKKGEMMYRSLLERFLNLKMMDGEGSGGTGGTGSDGGAGGSEGGEGGKGEKTFTQEDLNRIAAQEKRQGAASILKSLGFEKEKAENEKKDDLEKAKEETETEKKAKLEAEKKADMLEKKFKVVAAGVSTDKADDVLILANAKAVDGKSFEDALEEVKKSYPSLFEQQSSDPNKGTGTGGNPPRSKGGSEQSTLGKRLAEQRKASSQNNTKKSYFSN